MELNMKIACTGFVKKLTGSLGQANFILLEELLKRGHQIDFYGWPGFNEPKELLSFPGFSYIPVPSEENLVSYCLKMLPDKIRNLIVPFVNILVLDKSSYGSLMRELLRRNQSENYDVLCFLGLFPPVSTREIPIVSWIQGPPQTEWFYIRKLKQKIIKYCGLSSYVMFHLFYAFKSLTMRQYVKNSGFLICSSSWSKERIVDYGVSENNVFVIPHPIDTSLFSLNESCKDKEKKVLLYLGRITTRKRLDLLLEAFSLLLKERQDVHLQVCGSPTGIEKGYMRLIENFPFPNHLEYISYVAQTEVPRLFAECDVLVQPSEGENFGHSVAEALCCGTPVVLGMTNGTKDFVGDSSFIFEEYTPQCLKAAMLRAIVSVESEPLQVALSARKAAEEHLGVATVTTQFEEILQKEILKKTICYR
jgi:glycosyltransferase involved in cell wall biosynthesis